VSEVVCPKCGSEYSVKEIKIPMKDTDTEECEVCGEVLKRWHKSTTMYHVQLKVRRENHLRSDHSR
jgi:predicted Zn finger-like uncharacterized protein